MEKRTSGELKRLAREFLNGNYTILIAGMLLTAFLPMLLLTPFSAGVRVRLDAVLVTFLTAAVIINVLEQLLKAGLIRMHLLRAQNQPYTYLDLFWTFRSRPDRFILAVLLFYGILLIPAAAGAVCIYFLIGTRSAIGYVLAALVSAAAVSAEIYLVYMFGLVFPLYIDHPDMSVIDGFRTSCRLMKGNKLRFFILQLSFAGWQVLGFLSAGIGSLWISPYFRQTMANFYLDLTGRLETECLNDKDVQTGL